MLTTGFFFKTLKTILMLISCLAFIFYTYGNIIRIRDGSSYFFPFFKSIITNSDQKECVPLKNDSVPLCVNDSFPAMNSLLLRNLNQNFGDIRSFKEIGIQKQSTGDIPAPKDIDDLLEIGQQDCLYELLNTSEGTFVIKMKTKFACRNSYFRADVVPGFKGKIIEMTFDVERPGSDDLIPEIHLAGKTKITHSDHNGWAQFAQRLPRIPHDNDLVSVDGEFSFSVKKGTHQPYIETGRSIFAGVGTWPQAGQELMVIYQKYFEGIKPIDDSYPREGLFLNSYLEHGGETTKVHVTALLPNEDSWSFYANLNSLSKDNWNLRSVTVHLAEGPLKTSVTALSALDYDYAIAMVENGVCPSNSVKCIFKELAVFHEALGVSSSINGDLSFSSDFTSSNVP